MQKICEKISLAVLLGIVFTALLFTCFAYAGEPVDSEHLEEALKESLKNNELFSYPPSHVGDENGEELSPEISIGYYNTGALAYVINQSCFVYRDRGYDENGNEVHYKKGRGYWTYEPVTIAGIGAQPGAYYLGLLHNDDMYEEFGAPDILSTGLDMEPEIEELSEGYSMENDLQNDFPDYTGTSGYKEPEETNNEAEVPDPVYSKSMGAYGIYIVDTQELLTDSEKMQLTEYMTPITDHGNAIFVTANSYDAENTAISWYRKFSGTDSGVIFLIDMGCREIYIFSDGEINKKIGKTYALGITDNVYRYATDGKYFECAKEAFSEIYTVLSAGNLLVPMKYINNFFLAFAFSLFFMYLLAAGKRRKYMAVSGSDSEYARREACAKRTESIVFSNVQKVLYDVIYHSSSSGGDSSGDSSGGGSSGSGGGHGF